MSAKWPYETATVGGGAPDTVARPWGGRPGQHAGVSPSRRPLYGLRHHRGPYAALFDAYDPRSPEGPENEGENRGKP